MCSAVTVDWPAQGMLQSCFHRGYRRRHQTTQMLPRPSSSSPPSRLPRRLVLPPFPPRLLPRPPLLFPRPPLLLGLGVFPLNRPRLCPLALLLLCRPPLRPRGRPRPLRLSPGPP